MISVFPDIIKGVGNTLILSHAVKKITCTSDELNFKESFK